jgi:hypothetical protein
MNITDFLEARIAEDEKRAIEYQQYPGWWKPARVLAECASKRAILGEYEGLTFEQRSTFDSWEPYRSVMRAVLKSLAAVYKDHPDYQKEWAK